MSRIHFHSPSGTVEVMGWERAHLGLISADVGSALLSHMSAYSETTKRLIELMPAGHILRARPGEVGTPQWADWYRLMMNHGTSDGPMIEWNGRRVDEWQVLLNTALVLGSTPVKLATRIHAQCEIHGWVDGPARAWLAGVIHTAREQEVFRPDAGWEAVMDLLLTRDDEPVVMSYTVTDWFPNRECSTWQPPTVVEFDPEIESESDRLDELWGALADLVKWDYAVEWLHGPGSGLQLSPIGWSDYRVGHRLSLFDLLAKDYTARLDAAFPPVQ